MSTEKSARVLDFEARAKSVDGRYQLITLRNGEIRAMSDMGAEYQKDRRRKKFYRAWQEHCLWIKEINQVLGIKGWMLLDPPDAFNVARKWMMEQYQGWQ